MSKSEGSDVRTTLQEQVIRRFSQNVAEHVVEALHREGDTVRLWRCGKPKSSTYMFYVCAAPNCLMVYGDMGEYMWQRHYDMVPFVRGSIHSLDYFSEKAARNIKIKDHYPELVEEWFDTIEDFFFECGREWGDEEREALETIRDKYEEYDSKADFDCALYESVLYHDFEDIPDTCWYSYEYLWVIEGLKWWIQQIDSIESQVDGGER